jgi:ElaB/YqjD/DUF883 family membrane-anchored ribosome-binding protein
MDVVESGPDDEATSDINSLRADVAELKRDLAAALEHFKASLDARDRNAGDRIADSATAIYEDLCMRSEEAVESLSNHIEQHPLRSALMAFSIGIILSRFFHAPVYRYER